MILLYAGKFDPFHYGHMDAINKVLNRDQTISKIVISPTEREKTKFSLQERIQLIIKAIPKINGNVEIVPNADNITFISQCKSQVLILLGEDKLSKISFWKETELIYNNCFFKVNKRAPKQSGTNVRQLLSTKNLQQLKKLLPYLSAQQIDQIIQRKSQ